MSRELLLVTEYGSVSSEMLKRFELWESSVYTIEEWTRTKRFSSWRHTGDTVTAHDLESALESYRRYVYDHGIGNEDGCPRGVAFRANVYDWAREELDGAVVMILTEISDFDSNFVEDDYATLHHSYRGVFHDRLPRGIVGDGCWSVQFVGLSACIDCPGTLCPGEETVREGNNSVAVEIPILQNI